MLRSFLMLTLVVVVFAALGSLVAGPHGGLFGVLLAATLALTARTVGSGRRRPGTGAALHRAHERALCVPNGCFAELDLVHDGDHWCDVESCSIGDAGAKLVCHKRCLDLLNDVAPPRRRSLAAL